jgi:choline dehydrogenase
MTEPDPGLNGRALRYPRGRTLGGCSSINGMIYMRGQARDYDAWAEITGEPAWSWENALPDFIAHEDHWRMARRRPRPRLRRAARPRRRMARREAAPEMGDPRGLRRRLRRRRHPRAPRTSTAAPTRASAISRSTSAAAGAGTPPRPSCARCAAGQPRGLDRGRGPPRRDRRGPQRPRLHRGRAAPPRRGRTRRGRGPARGDPRRRRGEQPQAPDALRHRPGRGARGPRHRRRAPTCPASASNLQDHLQIRSVYRVDGVRPSTRWRAARRQGDDRPRIRARPHRPDEHGALPARRLHPLEPRARAPQHRVPRPAAQPRGLRRAAARFPAFTASVCNLNPTSRGRSSCARPTRRRRRRSGRTTSPPTRTAGSPPTLRVVRRIVDQPPLARFRPEE